jgi:hypothetical protein
VFEKSVKNLQRGEGQAAVTIEEFIIVSKEMIPQLIINKHDNFDKVIKDANSKKNFFDFIGALDSCQLPQLDEHSECAQIHWL